MIKHLKVKDFDDTKNSEVFIMTKIIIKTVEEFVERIKNKQSVSSLDFDLGFKWTTKTSEVLRSANLSFANLRSADLRSADLRSADLSFANLSFANLSFANLRSADLRSADLRYANGEFIFNYGVKLKVVSH